MRTISGSRAVVLAGLLLGCSGLVASGASAAEPVTVSVTGTIDHVVLDNDAAAGGQPDDALTSTEPFVFVDGVLHRLPDGTAVPPGPSGQDVVVTLEAPPGVSGEEALVLADADVASPQARVVEVVAGRARTPSTPTAPTSWAARRSRPRAT
ncbi:hypothetical protein [Pengzhenrongella sp.]|uniref:hypothetical protein n=1 Tax=Pengzhenrongella sp. TaxID=2888820 RepID=UPI002F94D9BC